MKRSEMIDDETYVVEDRMFCTSCDCFGDCTVTLDFSSPRTVGFKFECERCGAEITGWGDSDE